MSEKGFRIEIPMHIKRDRRARKIVRKGPALETAPDPVPRIARLLALAHKWEGMVRRGEVKDHAEIAIRLRITKGRITQICGLAQLAPSIQNALIHSTTSRAVPTHSLRRILRDSRWDEQWRIWKRLTSRDAH